jgi:predicted DCC family thiol-disulfide oxidoreductase YuxK
MSTPRLTLFYDGLCPLCSLEVAHYRKRAVEGTVAFVDITDPLFDAARHGLDPRRVHEVMHVKVGDELRTGVDAFFALWDVVPGHRWLARLARLPGVYSLLKLLYHGFAKVRPWLPRRRRAECESGSCKTSAFG